VKRFDYGRRCECESFDEKKVVAEIAMFILALAPGTRVNAIDSPPSTRHEIIGPKSLAVHSLLSTRPKYNIHQCTYIIGKYGVY